MQISSAQTYDSAQRGLPLVDELKELVLYRDLLRQLIARNLKMRYKRSALGIIWTMIHPLMMMVVLTLAFSHIWRATLPHFSVYVLAGLILWNFFSQTTNSAMSELLWGGNLLTRIYVPRGVFAVTALGTGLVNLALSIPPLLLLMLATGCPVRPAMLFLPVAVLLLSMFTMGVGLILSTLVIYFADVYEMFQILLMSWFYLQPTMYPLEIIPESSRWLFKLNPLYYYLELFRSPIHQGALAPWPFLVIGSLIAVVTLGFGWWLFTKHADQMAYRV